MDKSLYTRQGDLYRQLLIDTRVASGAHQTLVAERLGKPQSFVSKYESGARRLDVLELREVCVAIGTDYLSFLAELEEVFGRERV